MYVATKSQMAIGDTFHLITYDSTPCFVDVNTFYSNYLFC